MTTLNENLNSIFTTLNNTVGAAEKTRDDAQAKAQAEFAKVEAKATSAFNKALAKAANDFFNADGTLDEFAQAYGKSTVTTRNHLKALDVDVPVGKKGAKSKFDTEKKTEIAQAWLNGDKKTRLMLALENDVTEATMRNWAIDLGLHTPVKREAQAETPVAETVDA